MVKETRLEAFRSDFGLLKHDIRMLLHARREIKDNDLSARRFIKVTLLDIAVDIRELGKNLINPPEKGD